MLENPPNRATEKTPIRIRPPDSQTHVEAASERKESEHPNLSTEASLPSLPRWLSVEQVRKMQRMRRETVIEAMLNGELPFEQRGRIRYVRLSDVIAWEERRLNAKLTAIRGLVHVDLKHLL